MEKYVWLFPIIFIFHDMEEIIGFGHWLTKNEKMLNEKYPFVMKTYKDFSTEGIALAVFEELCVSLLFSILAFFTNNEYMWYLWFGGFVACTVHFVVHIAQAIILKMYIPALLTSILCLPVSVWILTLCVQELNATMGTLVISSVVGIVIVLVNLKFAQSLIGWFTRKLRK